MGDEKNEIHTIIATFKDVTEKLSKNTTAINHAIDNFSAISDSVRASNLKSTLLELNQTIHDVNLMISNAKNGKGPDGTLLSENKVYQNLQKTSADLDVLIKDLKENPERYLSISVINLGGHKKTGK